MQEMTFNEFIASLEEFDLADRALYAHAKHAHAPEMVVRFSTTDPVKAVKYNSTPPSNKLEPVYSCYYETFTFPSMTGTEPIQLLHITGPDTDFFFSPRYQVFLRRKIVL